MSASKDSEFRQLDAICQLPVAAGRSLAYGEHPDQRLELYGTPQTASCCVVLVHGGYFREKHDLAHMRPMAAALAERGALVALVEYRRAGGAGGYPRTLADIGTAIGFVQQHLHDWRLNARAADNVVVSGHSAGGCLVLAWASHQPVDGPTVRLCPMAPVSDLMREANQRLADGAVLDYMGASPAEDINRYLQEDPRSRAACIPPRMAPTMVHGTLDQIVDIGFSRDFPAQRVELEGAGHFDLVDPQSRYFDDVVRVLVGG